MRRVVMFAMLLSLTLTMMTAVYAWRIPWPKPPCPHPCCVDIECPIGVPKCELRGGACECVCVV
jgi:hypothetical protein